MHRSKLRVCVIAIGASIVIGSLASVSPAGVTYDGWNYAIDSQNDGSGAAQGFEIDPAGNQVFGLSFSSNLVPTGDFTAHLLYECGNDGVALQGFVDDVVINQGSPAPEPSSLVIGMATALIFGGWTFSRRRSQRSHQA